MNTPTMCVSLKTLETADRFEYEQIRFVKNTSPTTETMTKLCRNKNISMDAIKRIYQACNCNIEDMMDLLPKEEK